jgi:hypothetical protein
MTTDSTTDPRAPFRRAMTLGTVPYGHHNRSTVTVDVTWDGERLSITGSERAGREDVSFGQIADTARHARPRGGDLHTAEDVRRLCAIWDRWHLNDMRPGCEHQRAAGWGERRIDPSKPARAYGRHHPNQRGDTWNLLGWVYPSEVPGGLMTAPCPVCGYRYGTEWRTEDVPTGVLVALREVTRHGRDLTSTIEAAA